MTTQEGCRSQHLIRLALFGGGLQSGQYSAAKLIYKHLYKVQLGSGMYMIKEGWEKVWHILVEVALAMFDSVRCND